MAEVLFKTFITFFSIYALIDICTKAIKLIFHKSEFKNEVFVVIKVKNQENKIEGVVRSVIFKFLKNNGGGRLPFILIVDFGSTDSTKEIALKLCDDYDFIYYMTEEKYNQIKKHLPV